MRLRGIGDSGEILLCGVVRNIEIQDGDDYI